MGKATIVSVCPFPIRETKAGMYPSSFVIEAAEEGGIAILHVGDGWYSVRLDEDRPPLKVTCPAEQVAQSVINDYAQAQLGYTSDSGPGLFAVWDHLNAEQIMKLHENELEKAISRQVKWFRSLVMQANDEWAKFHQHRMITDTQRYAAKFLKLTHDWVSPVPEAGSIVECPVCTNSVPVKALMCANCHVAMPGKEEELKKHYFVVKKGDGEIVQLQPAPEGDVAFLSKG